MIIDSHAHYSHAKFENSFRFLTTASGAYQIAEGTLDTIFTAMHESGIVAAIEPGITLESNKSVLALSEKHPDSIFPAIGVHPTRTYNEQWSDRKNLDALAMSSRVVAIGETGLDFHQKRSQQHRWCQLRWFYYQLNLACRRKLPTILHIRNADSLAIQILKHHPARKLGGVIHCFNRNYRYAHQYLKMGYHIGIGASLLQSDNYSAELEDTVRKTPLERILVETDSPYVLPYRDNPFTRKVLRKTRNTSLILPKVIERIAELKELSIEQVENQTLLNAIRLFSLPVCPEDAFPSEP